MLTTPKHCDHQFHHLQQLCTIIIITGRPATGKTSHCEELIKFIKKNYPTNYTPIFLDIDSLLMDNTYTQEYTEHIKTLKKNGKLKYNLDPTIWTIILQRFFQANNTKEKIIIFYRGPTSEKVAKELGKTFLPNFYIYLDSSVEDLVERVCGRRVDLLSGKTFHIKYDAEYLGKHQKEMKLSQRIGDDEKLFIPRIERSDKSLLPVLSYYQSLALQQQQENGDEEDRTRVVVKRIVCTNDMTKELIFQEIKSTIKNFR
ncbi:hypothetical protein ABK040_005008 [Willaertia magna]